MDKKIKTTVLMQERDTSAKPPSEIIGYVSVYSKGKKSVFDAELNQIVSHNHRFHGSKSSRGSAEKALGKMGFNILAGSKLGFSVSGPAEAYEELTGGTIQAYEQLINGEGGIARYSTRFDIVGPGQPKYRSLGVARSKSCRIEGVLLEEPMVLHGVAPAPLPPTVEGDYLRVPDDVGAALGASGAHRAGYVGEGVNVAMVDSGQYAHPFFDFHAYDVAPTTAMIPGTDPSVDPNGHGTGESANIFSVAPGIRLHAFRASSDPSPSGPSRLVGAMSGFMAAKARNPDVLTNSWGSDGWYPPSSPPDPRSLAAAAELVDAVERGIFVVFSAGNGQFGIHPQVPGVFAAGGVFMARNLDLSASDYCSGYASPDSWFPGVIVPDASGLVGMRPRAQSIMLPVPAGSELDIAMSDPVEIGGRVVPGDGTSATDGWARFSGTSAAAPQVAGAAALILGAKPGLTPQQVTEALTHTATDVVTGRNHPRFNAGATFGPDLATGFGLVNASAALDYALSNF